MACAASIRWPRCRRWCATWTTRSRLAFPLRRGLAWRRHRRRTAGRRHRATCCPVSRRCSTARCSARPTLEAVGVPDLRLFIRGDEVEVHRRLVRVRAAVRHLPGRGVPAPAGRRRVQADPGRAHAHPVSRNDAKRYFTYRNRGYLQAQRGLRRADPAGVGAVRLVLPGDPPRPGRAAWSGCGCDDWAGRRSSKGSRASGDRMTFTDAAAAVEDVRPAPGATWPPASASASCGCTWAGRTSSSATAARCSARSGSPSPPAPWPSRWAGCTRSCSSSQLAEHLPYVTLGLIIWNLINASIIEGADVFVANEGLIKQLPHTAVRARLPAGVAPDARCSRTTSSSSWSSRSSSRSRGSGPTWRSSRRWCLIVLNCVWVALCFGILATPLPRHQPAAVQPGAAVLLHDPDHLERPERCATRAPAAGRRSSSSTPLLHYVDIVPGAAAGRRPGAAALDRGAGADRHSAGSWRRSPCGSTGRGAVLGVVRPFTRTQSSIRLRRG